MINILKTRCMGYQVIPAISQHLPYFTFSETCNCHAVSKFVRMFCGGTDVLQKMHHYVVQSPMFVLGSHLVCKPLMQGPSNPDKGFFK